MKNYRVTIVILNWNGKEDTLECLGSVVAVEGDALDVIVVDNGSTDSSVEAIQGRYPDITLLETQKNLGYAGGNNVGIEYALRRGADFVILLNNDAVLATDAIERWIETHEAMGSEPVLGAKIYYLDNPGVVWYAGGEYREESITFAHVGRDEIDKGQYEGVVETDYVSGCALFASAKTFREVGLLDDNFFLLYEETDWCFRARQKGHRCYVVSAVKVWHKVSSSFGGNGSPLYTYFWHRNRLLWAEKHLRFRERLRLYGNVIKDDWRLVAPQWPKSLDGEVGLLRGMMWAMASAVRDVRRNLHHPITKAMFRGQIDYVLRRFGDCPESVRLLGVHK